jgi:hypothetical protein
MMPVAIRAALLGLALVGAGCAVGGSPSEGGPDDAAVGSQVDSGRGPPPPRSDAGPTDAAVPDASVNHEPDHLLITEVMTMPFGSVSGTRAEFVEIWNPTGQTFDLSVYYLSDSKAYARLPEGDVEVEDQTDFIVRFPLGSSISPDQVIVVAIDGEGFEEAYGQVADYAIKEPGDATPMTIVDIGSNTSNVGFANTGEGIVLFHWNGLSNLVQDVDMIMTGSRDDRDHVHNILDKTELPPVDGPASGTDTYRPDAFTMGDVRGQFESATPVGRSYKRIALEGPHILRSGGNGITGHDETSEDIRRTWDNQQDPDGYTPPTPGEIPDSLRQQAAALRGW